LSRHDKKVAVLAAGTLGSGATAYTTAFITQVIDTSLSDLIRMVGPKKAQRVWQSGEQAIDRIETMAEKEKIDCEFQRCSKTRRCRLKFSTMLNVGDAHRSLWRTLW
jgi:glycine/D-amino acid oxidase-like deaminating enzyme